MTAQQAAERWGIKPRRVQVLCQQGRVPGAKQEIISGKCTWTMPEQDKPQELKPGAKAKPR